MTQGEYDFNGKFFGERNKKSEDELEKDSLISFLGNALIVHFIIDLGIIAVMLWLIIK